MYDPNLHLAQNNKKKGQEWEALKTFTSQPEQTQTAETSVEELTKKPKMRRLARLGLAVILAAGIGVGAAACANSSDKVMSLTEIDQAGADKELSYQKVTDVKLKQGAAARTRPQVIQNTAGETNSTGTLKEDIELEPGSVYVVQDSNDGEAIGVLVNSLPEESKTTLDIPEDCPVVWFCGGAETHEMTRAENAN